MALIWKTREGADTIEVRSAGRTRRLYSNGVFHSQYNPTRPLTGGVWDLLMVPAFFLPAQSIKRVLVLGVGGGTVLRQLNHFLQPGSMVGIELSAAHLHIAKTYFEAETPNTRLLHGDAIDWVKRWQGEKFDYIVEDLYSSRCDDHGNPVRGVTADTKWFSMLNRLLSPNGILVMNYIDQMQLKQSAWFEDDKVKKRFVSACVLSCDAHENRVAAFSRTDLKAAQLRKNLRQIPALDTRKSSVLLNYRIRTIR